MTILACTLSVMICGQPSIIAMTGALLRETNNSYLVDFSHAASAIEGLTGDFKEILVDKELCIKETK